MIDFKGKKILITGATGGIGKSLVEKFISLNGTILATGTNTEKLDSLKKEFPNAQIDLIVKKEWLPLLSTIHI